MEQEIQQIDLDAIIKEKMPKLYAFIPRFFLNWLKKLIRQEEINDVIRRLGHLYGVVFAKALIQDFNITIEVEGLGNLPKTEHLCTFASNHPLGGLDGVALAAVFGEQYPNIKLVVNDVLMNLVNLAPIFVPINKYGSQEKGSASALNEAYASDAQMVVFPAGMVSRKQKDGIADLTWKKNFIVKTVQFQRDVVPVYFEGRNSKRFYNIARWRKWFGLPNIELILLPDELFRNKNAHFKVKIGRPISWKLFDDSATRTEWAEYVKNIVYGL